MVKTRLERHVRDKTDPVTAGTWVTVAREQILRYA